jgi:hypothetical protein
MLCLGLLLASAATAADVPFELGKFGEITAWLMIKAPDTPFDQDPFGPMGGEAKYAAMGDPKLLPASGSALEFPGGKPGENVRIGEGVWEATRMSPPDMPGIFNEYWRLVVPEGYRYAYCRLDSPGDLKGGLLMGLNRNGGKCRLYLNGKELGVVDGGWGMETKYELPIVIKKGANHLLARFNYGTTFACRLVGEGAEPLKAVKVVVNAPNARAVKAPAAAPVPEDQKWANLVKAIPPPAPPAHPEFLGAKLARTMTLLESGKYTHRPVRIVFSGQSIEAGWTDQFIKNLRERYPDTKIICENRALGGWFVWRMQKLLKHDILRWQPDLVLFSAYQGTAEVWERFISELRAETTADIVIRTNHIGGWEKLEDPYEGAETITLRRLAQQYDVEFIEVRREWLDYLKANQMQIKDLLRDNIHINQKGDTLMALLYDRHFQYNAASRQGWAERVRRFDVGRFLEDHKTDGIVLEGEGWQRKERFARSNSAGDVLKLKFRGTRVDLVLPIGHGKATVLIDGRKPSELNLFHGTRPQGRTMADTDSKLKPNSPMTYHTGTNMQEETWVLAITAGNADEDVKRANQRVRFRLTGSKTGFDGEGQSDLKFVSNSGRITLLPCDWMTEMTPPGEKEPPPVMKAFDKPVQYVWHIQPDGMDTVPMGPGWVENTDHYCGWAYEYVTVADGLSYGLHELTLSPVPDPNPNQAFIISGAEVHCPPLARDVAEQTRVP